MTTERDAVGGPVDCHVGRHEPRTNAALAKTIDSCGYLSTEVHGALTDCCRELERDLERMRVALNWYADEARACAQNSGTARHTAGEALLASVTVLALDGGKRADEAMTPNVPLSGPHRLHGEAKA